MTLLVLPGTVLTTTLAYSLYCAALANLQATQAAAAVGRAASLRAWLDASGRSLANESAAASLLTPERCMQLSEAFLKYNDGLSSIRLYDQNAGPCTAGAAFDGEPPPRGEVDEAGYRLAVLTGRLWIVAGSQKATSVVLVDLAALRKRLSLTAVAGATHVALIGAGGTPISQDVAGLEARWAPPRLDPALGQTFRTLDCDGVTGAFALASIDPDLSVLLRFDDRHYSAAWRRFFILCCAQLGIMALLAMVYLVAIRRDVVQWVESIDRAARLRGGDPSSAALAPVSAKMPRELRNVAESFNIMADHAEKRREALETSLAENRALMLEMHHRIKNSLQVIQSYLALMRRNGPRAEAQVVARIEARVGVIAVAYRLALTPKGMRPIRVKPFLEEGVAAAAGGLKRPRQRVTGDIAWDGELIVDRAIPLGLALAEALIGALDAPDVTWVSARLAPEVDGMVTLVVVTDVTSSSPVLPEKVMRGLAAQLGATPAPLLPGVILCWRFVS